MTPLVKDAQNRRSTTKVATVKAAIEDNGQVSHEKLEDTRGINATSVLRILMKDLGFSKKAAKWVPHQLTPEH